jgi:hypothetical protein
MKHDIRPHELTRELILLSHEFVSEDIQKEFYKQAGVALREEFHGHFQSSSTPDGQPLMPLKQPRASGNAGGPLTDRGHFRSAASNANSQWHKETVTNTALRLDITIPYGEAHQRDVMIRPVRAENLAIPVSLNAARRSPRQFPGPLVVIVRNVGGSPKAIGLAEAQGAPLDYVFAKWVRRPARVVVGIGKRAADRLAALLSAVIHKRNS